MDDIASPPQLKVALQEIEDLKLYKTKAMTAFMVVQFIMATAIALSSYF